jgi:hypothetical protein
MPNLPINDFSAIFGNSDTDTWQTDSKTPAKALKAGRRATVLTIPGADVERFVPSAVKLARGLKDYPVESSFKV